jgi:hypothetical protein
LYNSTRVGIDDDDVNYNRVPAYSGTIFRPSATVIKKSSRNF